jgi:hypothetical protein
LSFLTFLADQQSKLTKITQNLISKHVSGGERARRADIFFEKIKISADSDEIWLALA